MSIVVTFYLEADMRHCCIKHLLLVLSFHEHYEIIPTPFSINDEDTKEWPLLHLGRL